jgi:hypothetical protein
MPLGFAKLTASATWVLTRINPGFKTAKQGPDYLSSNLAYDPADVTKLVGSKYVITGSGVQTVDLSNQIDLLNTAVSYGKICGFILTVSGNDIKITGHGTNGLSTWFLRNSGEFWIADGGFAAIGWTFPKAATVDSTHKILTFTNSSGAVATVTLALFGA